VKIDYLFGSTQSTMQEYDRLQSISDHSTQITVRALSQTQGRGRDKHSWHSPIGGLWFTFALTHPAVVESFALYAGHCLHRLLSDIYNLPHLKVKWTNDLYYMDKKLAGVLCRHSVQKQRYTIGLGLNTNNTFANSEHEFNAISLSDILGFQVANPHLMSLYIDIVNDYKEELFTPASYLGYCRDHLYGIGKEVQIEQGKNIQTGILKGIDEQGFLLIDDGEIKTISHGSIRIINP